MQSCHGLCLQGLARALTAVPHGGAWQEGTKLPCPREPGVSVHPQTTPCWWGPMAPRGTHGVAAWLRQAQLTGGGKLCHGAGPRGAALHPSSRHPSSRHPSQARSCEDAAGGRGVGTQHRDTVWGHSLGTQHRDTQLVLAVSRGRR